MQLVQADTFAGKGIAIEQGNQLHQPGHVAPAVQNEHQIRGRIHFYHGIGVREFLDHLAELVDVDVLQKNQVEHELVVGGNFASIDLKRDRLADDIGERNDPVDLTLLNHTETIHAQNHVEQIAGIEILRLAVGVERDGAFDARVYLDI